MANPYTPSKDKQTSPTICQNKTTDGGGVAPGFGLARQQLRSLSVGIEIRPLSAHTALPPCRTGLPPRLAAWVMNWCMFNKIIFTSLLCYHPPVI